MTASGARSRAALLLAVLCVLPAASFQGRAAAEAPSPDSPGQAAPGAVSGAGVEALKAGRRAKADGRLALAEARFQEALAAAPRDGEVFAAALAELTWDLPLMRVQRHVVNGRWREAERLLQDLLERHSGDEDRRHHVVRLIAEVRDRAPEEGGVLRDPGGGKKAVRYVERALERFFRENGRYPRDYAELNRILPADRFPLEGYDIVHYVSRGEAYGLTLRSKANPENLLSIQRTGLVE